MTTRRTEAHLMAKSRSDDDQLLARSAKVEEIRLKDIEQLQ